MSKNSSSLPDFESPPVIEVVIGVSFKHMEHLTTSDFGMFWQHIKEEYPLFEDHAPLADPSYEEGQVQIETLDKPPLRRVFFLNSTKNYLVQLQPDRFIHNWRKIEKSDSYPHFPAAKERFNAAWDKFRKFVAERELDPVQLVQFEVTYINHFVEEPGSFPVRAGYYTPIINLENARSTGFLPDPKVLAYNIQFPLPEDKGTLFVSCKHGTRGMDKKDVMLLTLSARGAIVGAEANLDEYFGLGHEWIVQGFKDLTSQAAHKQWKIIE